MGTKPTYKELEQRVKELEKEVVAVKQTQKALEKSEEHYRSLVSEINDGIFITNAGGTFTFVNKTLATVHGYESPEALIGKNFLELVYPGERDEVKDRFSRAVQGGEFTGETLEISTVGKDGGVAFIQLKAVPIMEEGRVVGAKGVIRDVTGRKQVEESLRESESKFRALAEQSPNMIFINQKGRIVYANQKCEEAMGYTRDEFCSDEFGFITLIAPEYRESIRENFSKHMSGKEIEPSEYALISKDGRRIEAIYTSKLIDYEGERAILGTVTDITERKHAEEELKQSERRLRAIIDDMPALVCRFLLDGTLTFASSDYCTYFNKRNEELIGHNFFTFIPPEEREGVRSQFLSLTKEKPVVTYEHKVIAPDGSTRWQQWTDRALLDEREEVVEYQSVGRDITEQKRAEEEREKLEAQLRYAHKMKALGTLAAGIAHNFNNLLQVIVANVSVMLLQIDYDHPHYESLKSIEKVVDAGANLTGQLLGYVREGKREIRPLNFNKLVKESSEVFGATRKDITFHRELADDLCGIRADQSQIEQVLWNLYANSSDAMPRGGKLFLQTKQVTDKQMTGKPYTITPGTYVLLTVRDTGIGMDQKTMERVFDPFFTTKGLAVRTGLGLASAYGIIKAHNGYIDVDSEIGVGTTFRIYLPALGERAETMTKSGERIARGTGTVLIVDDEEMILQGVGVFLETLGYTVLTAGSGKEAIAIYRLHMDTIDMVILDMIMPGMGGGETYDKLKETNPKVKLILTSGYDIDEQTTEIIERGCEGFIKKPFDMKELSQKIRDILNKK
jgi:two-component system cell cycle sensor histidine kinase/response regulator CckA